MDEEKAAAGLQAFLPARLKSSWRQVNTGGEQILGLGGGTRNSHRSGSGVVPGAPSVDKEPTTGSPEEERARLKAAVRAAETELAELKAGPSETGTRGGCHLYRPSAHAG